MDYQVVFDLTANPSQIQPDYWFYGLFLAIGLGLLAFARFLVRHRHEARYMVFPLSIGWLGLTAYVTVTDIKDATQIRSQVQQRVYRVAEGCLGYFEAGDPGGARGGNERWSVQGIDFDYGRGEVRLGYHRVEPRGGAVHSDTKVKVSFVTSEFYGRNEIVKLAVAQHACPSAPSIGT